MKFISKAQNAIFHLGTFTPNVAKLITFLYKTVNKEKKIVNENWGRSLTAFCLLYCFLFPMQFQIMIRYFKKMDVGYCARFIAESQNENGYPICSSVGEKMSITLF